MEMEMAAEAGTGTTKAGSIHSGGKRDIRTFSCSAKRETTVTHDFDLSLRLFTTWVFFKSIIHALVCGVTCEGFSEEKRRKLQDSKRI